MTYSIFILKRSLVVISLFVFFFSFRTDAQVVRINEFLALNQSGLTDEDGDYSDWIEIYNESSATVDLEGWALTDEAGNLFKWEFPDVSIPSKGYLIVFASGKDHAEAGSELHTNFKLSGSGEYLALVDGSGTIKTEFSPSFPEQVNDHSWGYYDGYWVDFSTPTPGAENEDSSIESYPTPVFSHEHGFYSNPFNLSITTPISGGAIYYTKDGSFPTLMNATLYKSSFQVTSTSVIRAIVYLGGIPVTEATTRTYLFTDDIIHQTNTPDGYPDEWGPYTILSGNSTADYEMDPEMIQDTVFAERVKSALISLPVMSLVSDAGNFFSHEEDEERGGIYIYTGPPLSSTTNGLGDGWERPVSMEFFDVRGVESLQVNCGIQLQGGHSRRPEKNPKHSFRLLFRKEYGPGRLTYPIFGSESKDSYNTMILRAGFGNTWLHWTSDERVRAHNARDVWSKDTQRELGHPSSRSIFVHLFINGLYWGIYNPSERLDSDYAELYLGGDADDYDVIKDYSQVMDGNIEAWNRLHQQANSGLITDEAYWKIQGKNPDGTRNPEYEALIDVDNLIDYMMLNFYGGNTDWDHHNWVAMRNRKNPGKGYKFFCWDQEHVLKSVNENILNEDNAGCPSRLFQQLRKNKSFIRRFADRVVDNCFEGGVLTPDEAAGRWMSRSIYIEGAIDAESARWGDYRRDVHRYSESGPFDLYTKDDYWLPARENIINNYFPYRTDNFIQQLQNAGLFSNTIAPELLLNGETVSGPNITQGDKVSLISDRGTIYYTLDGTDPVEEWDEINTWKGTESLEASVYSGDIVLTKSVHLKARVLYNGKWSALRESFFICSENYNDLKITEIHYHPEETDSIGSGDYEFIEIKNTGISTLNMEGIRFINGIEYKFEEETSLPSGGFIVLASKEEAFYSRYGFMPFSEYSGQLSNNGDWLVAVSPLNDTICSIYYSDGNDWPKKPDGDGYSLVPVELNPSGQQNSPSQWRASWRKGGSPGQDDLENDVIALKQANTNELFTLRQNYPNPFTGSTEIKYQLNENAHVYMSVYNLTGQKVAILSDQTLSAGEYQTEWNGHDITGKPLPSGIYLCLMEVKGKSASSVKSLKMFVNR